MASVGQKWDGGHIGNRNQSNQALEAASEAAAKVNAMLIAKGKLKPSQLSQHTTQKSKQSGNTNLVVAEVEINDVPLNSRNLLTRGATQEEISRMSGAAVSTRGRFMNPEEKLRASANDRPLYLCVQGPTQEMVDLAVNHVKDIIDVRTKPKPGQQPLQSLHTGPNLVPAQGHLGAQPGPPPALTGPQPALILNRPPPPLMSINAQPPPGIPLLQEKLYVGLEHAPPEFDCKERLEGPGASFLQHIESETGAKIMLQGRGSGIPDPITGHDSLEPLHLVVQHSTLRVVQQAKSLAENLIQTVQQTYAQYQQELALMPPRARSASIVAGVQPQTNGGLALIGQPPLQIQPIQPGLQIQPQPQQSPGGTIRLVVNTSVPPPTFAVPSSTSAIVTSFPAMPPSISSAGLQPSLQVPSGVSVSLQPPQTGISSQSGLPIAQPLPQSSNAPGQVQLQPQLQQVFLPPPQGSGPPPNVALPPGAPQPMILAHQQQLPPPGHQQNAPQLIDTPPTFELQQLNQGPQEAPQMPPGQQLGQGPHTIPPPGQLPGQLENQSMPGAPVPQPAGSQASQIPPVSSTAASHYYQQYLHQNSVSTNPSPSPVVSFASSSNERPHKRRFTEEKRDERPPENLLGYEHGPPHLANLTSGVREYNNDRLAPVADDQRLQGAQENSSLMPPPPPPPPGGITGKILPDSHLMPPPPPPDVSKGETEHKKGKFSEAEEDSVHSTLRQQQRNASKYAFNQYTSKPQIYPQEAGSNIYDAASQEDQFNQEQPSSSGMFAGQHHTFNPNVDRQGYERLRGPSPNQHQPLMQVNTHQTGQQFANRFSPPVHNSSTSPPPTTFDTSQGQGSFTNNPALYQPPPNMPGHFSNMPLVPLSNMPPQYFN